MRTKLSVSLFAITLFSTSTVVSTRAAPFVANGPLATARFYHSATLLPNGKVLVAGGQTATFFTNSAELYDPANGTWTATGALSTNRAQHTATLLLNDPVAGKWTTTAPLNTARYHHTATLLPNGKVLVAGGGNDFGSLTSAELFDPISETWTNTGALNVSREFHTATLLPGGKVLAAAGLNSGSSFLTSSELYDPATKKWTATDGVTPARENHTATLLPNGKVLVVAGDNGSTLGGAEVYDVGLNFNTTWQPQIATATSPLNLGSSFLATGSKFRGVSEGSGGVNSQDSPSDYPVVQLRGVENGQTLFLPATSWSTNSFVSVPVGNFWPGYALATVFVNGIQSTSAVINVSVPIPTAPILTDTKKPANGSFQFGFTNSSGVLFGALAATNVTVRLTNWTALGLATEISPGHFQFNDPQATNFPQRFYRVRSAP
jgi:hypothetical protein